MSFVETPKAGTSIEYYHRKQLTPKLTSHDDDDRAGSAGTWSPTETDMGLDGRGLYCLGVEDEGVLAELNHPLSAHEKLELRLSLPREFWPKKWLHDHDEE